MAVFGTPVAHYIDGFVKDVEDDLTAPAQSKFQEGMPNIKRNVLAIEETLSGYKSYVRKMIGSLREAVKAGDHHSTALTTFATDLVKTGAAMCASEPVLGNTFVKYGTLLNQTAAQLNTLVSSTRNIVYFSINMLFENELKGAKYKSNINSLMNQYDSARNGVEKEEKKRLVGQGINVQDKTFTAEELAGKLIADRRKFQLGICEYMLKQNDVRTKRGVDLAEHLVGFYQAQESYFTEGTKLMSALKSWEEKLTTQISELRTAQDKERKKLVSLKEKLREDIGGSVNHAGITQVDPADSTGLMQKSGYLAKRPDNMLRLARKQWPKRYCTVSMNGFTMAHSHTHAPHVRIPVMLFQFKDCGEVDAHKNCFKLQAQTRAYTFDADSDTELNQWRQVMTNCQLQLFEGGTIHPSADSSKTDKNVPSSPTSSGDTRQLAKRIITKIRALPGNDRCCDCNSHDPEWLSVNLGVLMCIHCSGRHRELGVQYSRIRSLKLDAIKTSELLIARVMGNALLNEVLEANMTDTKITPDVSTEQRKEYIVNKYTNRKYVEHIPDFMDPQSDLLEAVELRDVRQLLQVYAEGVDMCQVLPTLSCGRTALHLAIEQEDLTSLHIIDFILGNSRSENKADEDGNTPLHIAADTDNPQCIKLLLNHGAHVNTKRSDGMTALDIAQEKNYDDCIELLQDAVKGKLTRCEHIDIDWGVGHEEEDIYHSPAELKNPSAMRRSGTAENLSDSAGITPSPHMSRKMPSSPSVTAHRRPMSQFVDTRPYSPNLSDRSPARTHHPTFLIPPPPSAPPPPPRTVSKTAEALQPNPTGLPVAPKRTKRKSMIPELTEEPTDSSNPLLVVVALYDCDPDQRDELGFKEGQRIVVTAKISKEWWRGYVEGNENRDGLFPVNYIKQQ